MSFNDCIDEIRKASGGALSDDQILEALEEFDAVARGIAEQKPWANVQEELFGHAQRMAKEARERLLIERRNKSINNRAENKLREFLEQPAWAADPYAAVEARDVGAFGFEAKGGKASVYKTGAALGKHWIGSLLNAIEKRDLLPVLQRGVLDKQIAQELWELGRAKGGRPGISGSKEAQAAAGIIHRLQEVMIGRLNRAGAYIKRLPGYIIRQNHDPRLLRGAGFDKWFADVWPRVDEMRTFNQLLSGDQREAIYRKLYQDLSAGRSPSALEDKPWSQGGPLGGNLPKRLSRHRELHFKSGEDWHAYHDAYGQGTILENVAKSALSNSRAAALMEVYGTNPENMHAKFAEAADAKAREVGAATSEARNKLSPDTLFAVISGENNRPADARLARIATATRNFQIASKMGSAVVTAYLTDPVLQGNEMARHGVPFIKRMFQPWANVFNLATASKEQQQLSNSLLAYRDGIVNEVFGRFSFGEGGPGLSSWFSRKLMVLSGMNFWTDAHRSGLASVISHELASRTGTAFAALEPDYRGLLEAYGIGAGDWEKLAGALVTNEGVPYVVPSQLRLGDFGAGSDAAGRRAARRARDELATKLGTFLEDRTSAGLLEPGGRTRALLVGAERPGTWRGEAWRAFAMFKSFPTEMLVRVYGERGAQSQYGTLAALFATMTAVGAVTNIARDGLRGIAPPDYGNLDPQQMAQLFFRAAVTGGGAGVMGDFVLGDYSRFGSSAVATAAGPVFGQLDQVAQITSSALRGEGQEAFSKFVRFVYTNVPFANLWWTRTAMDYLILYQMQEVLNPGYLRRMEANRERETGQRYIVPPSQVIGR